MNAPTASEPVELWTQVQHEQDDKQEPKDVIDLTQDTDDEDQPASGQDVLSDYIKPEPTDSIDLSSTDGDDDSAPIQDVFSSGVPGHAATNMDLLSADLVYHPNLTKLSLAYHPGLCIFVCTKCHQGIRSGHLTTSHHIHGKHPLPIDVQVIFGCRIQTICKQLIGRDILAARIRSLSESTPDVSLEIR